MPSYLYDANASDIIQSMPQNLQFHPRATSSHPMLKILLSSMKRTNKKTKGRGKLIAPKGRGEGRGR